MFIQETVALPFQCAKVLFFFKSATIFEDIFHKILFFFYRIKVRRHAIHRMPSIPGPYFFFLLSV